ncbi:hypothetical protein CC79DRAFT_1362824 [Sarocladium strictum]
MLRPTLTKASALRPLRATFSTTARVMSEGATGAPPKTGGADSWQRREQASENMAIREREREKLLALRQQLKEQREHLDRLAEHIDDITKDQGGEKN